MHTVLISDPSAPTRVDADQRRPHCPVCLTTDAFARALTAIRARESGVPVVAAGEEFDRLKPDCDCRW